VPTVLDLLGQQPPTGLAGRSLVPLLGRGGLASLFGGSSSPAPDTYFEALSASINRRWAPLYGVREGSLKYVELPLPELYDLAVDPGETRNLAASRPADLDRLASRLGTLRAADTGVMPAPESPETLERLRALGYVAAARAAPPKERYTEDDDPKRLVALDAKTNEMLTLFHQGRIEEAIAVGREVTRARPDMDLAHLQLAYLERERGNLRGAIASAQRAVELRPGDAEASALLAVYLTESGRAREAAAFLAPWLKRGTDDLDVLNALGIALASSGRSKEALSVLDRARRAHPTNTQVLVNIGTVNLMAGAVDHARKAFEAALELDPDVARAHNSLGVIAARQGRGQEALERWKRAAELNPSDYQSLYNLGTRLWDSGRRVEARPYLEAYLRVAPRALEARDIAQVSRMLAGQRSR
jgi:Flp pilus assembly protein TadD